MGDLILFLDISAIYFQPIIPDIPTIFKENVRISTACWESQCDVTLITFVKHFTCFDAGGHVLNFCVKNAQSQRVMLLCTSTCVELAKRKKIKPIHAHKACAQTYFNRSVI